MKAVATLLVVAGALALSAGAARADISPDLGAVPVDGTAYRAAKSRYDQTTADRSAATSARTTAEEHLARLATDEASIATRIAADTAAREQATAELASARANLKVIAVTSYIQGSEDVAALDLDAESLDAAIQSQSHEFVFGTVRTNQVDRARAAQQAYDAATKRLDEDTAEQADIKTQIADTTAARDAAAADEVRLTDLLAQRTADLAEARATAMVVGVDFPLVALDAYYRAAATMAAVRPECGIAWWALAGITRVESKHGRAGGSELLANGDTSKPIIGIPLDGTNGTELIADTDGGQLDGDAEYDRAVGPMQFIPSTWQRWATDGNGDGRADPHNIYDAALSAARYLCAGGPMQTDDELTAGFLRYNHSGDYAQDVLSFAHQYAALVIPPPA